MKNKTLLWVEKTRCNIDCSYCYFEQEDRNSNQELPRDKLEKVIEDIEPNIVYISGGEPTLDKNLFDKINYLRDKNSKIVLTTNGTKLDKDYTKKLLNTNLEGILFSLDGPDQETNDLARDDFDNTIRGIKNAILLRNEYKTRIGICYVVHAKNVDKIDETINFAINLGVDYFTYQPVDIVKSSSGDLELNDQLYQRFLHNIANLKEKHGSKIILPSKEYFHALNNIKNKGYFGTPCYAGKNLHFLDENSKLRECPIKFEETENKEKYCKNESLNCITMIELVNSEFLS